MSRSFNFAHLRSCSSSEVSSLPVALEFSGPIEIVEDIIADKMVYPSSQNERYLVSKNFCFFKKKSLEDGLEIRAGFVPGNNNEPSF